MSGPKIVIRPATIADVPQILQLIRELADYEELLHEVVATEEELRESLFGEHPGAEVILGEVDGRTEGFALFFHNYSTFLGRRGIYLEDLYVRAPARGRGLGRQLLRTANERPSAAAGHTYPGHIHTCRMCDR